MKKMNGGTDPKKKGNAKSTTQMSKEGKAKVINNDALMEGRKNASKGGYSPSKDYQGGAVPRVGGKAQKASGLKAASKAQVKASKKFAVKPTVSKQMRKHSRGKR